jgi:arylsulfatase A-like enzyme
VPATASLFTSLYPPQHGLIENLGRKEMRRTKVREKEVAALPAAVKTLPEVMKEAGYATFGASDNFHVSSLRGFDRGFDRFGHGNDTGSVETNGRVLQWKAEIRSGKPYFLYVHYMDPHNPYRPHAPWTKDFSHDGKVPEWRGGNRRAAYDGEIRYLDDNIRALARELGWDEGNTLVFVTADHGEEFGEHGGGGHASSLYRELVEVPLVAWSSTGRFPPRRVADPVGLIDILPTLRQIAGLPVDPVAQGQSLVPLLESGTGGDRRRTFFTHIQTFGRRKQREIHGVIRERWKWLREPDGTELYDTYADRPETRNLATAEPRVTTDLAATWRRFSDTARRYESTKHTFHLDQETEDKLRALGYVQ